MGDNPGSSAKQPYAARLGVLTPEQFQAALERFDLGDFLGAEAIAQGLFGQNVFVSSTKGEYVLRGAPHYPWQFPKEQFGANLLHDHTEVPVPYPYLLDPATDIFGWSYLLMPRKPGVSVAQSRLSQAERVDIAHALGQNLAALHTLTWPFAGHYDLLTNTIQPFAEGFAAWFVSDVKQRLSTAAQHGGTGHDDIAWVEGMLQGATSVLTADFAPCFVMNDYNPNNVAVSKLRGEWQVTGLFDLMEYYFGDGEADLMRLSAAFLDEGGTLGSQLAQAFGAAYLERRPKRPGFASRYALFMLRDRLIVWEYGTRPGVRWFPAGQTFRRYAEPYLMSYRLLEASSAS